MKGLSPDQNQPSFLSPMLRDQLNPRHPLFLLSEKIPWRELEKEPETYCISKGKEHKKYEFGAKVSIVLTKDTGIIFGAVCHNTNQYDGHTLPEVLEQTTRLVGKEPKVAICDRGYRGISIVGHTQIVIPIFKLCQK